MSIAEEVKVARVNTELAVSPAQVLLEKVATSTLNTDDVDESVNAG